MPTLVETSVEVILLIIPLISLQELLGFLGLLGDGFSIQDMHDVNTVLLLRKFILDQEITLLPPLVWRRFPLAFAFGFGLPPRMA